LFTAALSGCSSITVYNRRVYGDLGKYGAHWAETLTDKKGDLTKEEWDKVRVGMLCMSSEAYTDAETAIDQACVQLNCDYKTRESLQRAMLRIRPIVESAEQAQLILPP